MSRALHVVLVASIVAWLSCPAAAQATENSLLDCDKSQVVPGERIGCRVYVRDAQMDPSINGRASDFAVRVTVDRDDSGVSVTPVQATDDVMVFAFAVSARLGTNLRIDVVLASTGALIRGSGFSVVVLIAPVQIQTIVCNATALTLRSSVSCTAALVGPENRPAVVTARDIVLTEDHSEGIFTFVSGIRSLTFTFTAPNFLSTTFSAFVLRATLMSAASASVTVSLPVGYPALAPTAKSVLKCSAGTCNVLSFDDLGPVAFDTTQFVVGFSRASSAQVGAPLIPINSAMKYAWVNLPFTNAKSLTYDAILPNEVFTCQLYVTTLQSGAAIAGSPVVVTIGVAPTPADVNFYRCLSSFVTSGLSTTCYLLVADSASADPKFLSIQAVTGLVGEARYRNITDDPLLVNRRVIAFDYIAPLDVKRRMEDNIFVTIGGVSVGRTPWRLILFPASTGDGGTTTVDRKNSVIVVASIFFGGVYLIGLIAWARRQRRKALVHEARRITFLQNSAAEVLHEMQNKDRPVTPVTRQIDEAEKVATPESGWLNPEWRVPEMPDEEDDDYVRPALGDTARPVPVVVTSDATAATAKPGAGASVTASAFSNRQASTDFPTAGPTGGRVPAEPQTDPDELLRTSMDNPPSPASTREGSSPKGRK